MASVKAQISPPGLGLANSADWFAVGLRQDLGRGKRSWQSMSYLGLGRKSNPDNHDPMYKPAIRVINQEFFRRPVPAWQYSAAASYREQDEYLNLPPYLHSNPKFTRELRAYGRVSYMREGTRFKFSPTFRQEARFFLRNTEQIAEESLQLRSRIKLQLTVNLDAGQVHRLILGSEQLFSAGRKNMLPHWTSFTYHESRFSAYYSFSPEGIPCTLDIGYMNNLIGGKNLRDVHYLGLDIVVKNLFKPHGTG